MTAPTAPYGATAGRFYGHSIEHVARLYALDLAGDELGELPLTSASITFDEGWTPYCQVQAVTPVPELTATLDELDPRTGTRLRIDAGYAYPGGSVDVHPLANVDLRRRIVNRPANDVNLTAQGDEVLALDNRSLGAPLALISTLTLVEAITQLITVATDSRPFDFEITTADAQLLGATINVLPTHNLMQLITQLANRGNLWVYVDELRVWHIADRAELGAVTTLNATTGYADSTITSADSETSSDDEWGNAVLVTFDDGTTVWAEVTSGPYATDVAPRRVVEVDGGPPPAAAIARSVFASSVLTRVSSRGRSITFESPSAYWLRPGQTITVELPTGGQQRVIVARVTFTTQDGRMTVTTRQPDDYTITTGE